MLELALFFERSELIESISMHNNIYDFFPYIDFPAL